MNTLDHPPVPLPGQEGGRDESGGHPQTPGPDTIGAPLLHHSHSNVVMALSEHKPVLLEETLAALQIRAGGRYLDCTLGGGGHAFAILERSAPDGRLLGIDADPAAIGIASERLKPFGGNVIMVNDNFRSLADICRKHGFSPVDGILFDLGFSSFQIAAADRGFSFQQDAPLDMRFSPDQTLSAADIVNTYSEAQLARVLEEYGEERRSRRIARFIVGNRPLRTTLELAEVAERAVGRGYARIHPATRTFQALRIEVNQELESFRRALDQAPELLKPGGRVAVISFHSLEDRIVKEFFRRESRGCLCPPQTPVCVCGHTPTLRIVTRKPITPASAEITANPRSRSAKLRVAERI